MEIKNGVPVVSGARWRVGTADPWILAIGAFGSSIMRATFKRRSLIKKLLRRINFIWFKYVKNKFKKLIFI